MSFAAFTTARLALYEKLDAAEHSVSFTLHIMEMDGSDRSIADYERALDCAAAVRRDIGEQNAEEMRARAAAACITA